VQYTNERPSQQAAAALLSRPESNKTHCPKPHRWREACALFDVSILTSFL